MKRSVFWFELVLNLYRRKRRAYVSNTRVASPYCAGESFVTNIFISFIALSGARMNLLSTYLSCVSTIVFVLVFFFIFLFKLFIMINVQYWLKWTKRCIVMICASKVENYCFACLTPFTEEATRHRVQFVECTSFSYAAAIVVRHLTDETIQLKSSARSVVLVRDEFMWSEVKFVFPFCGSRSFIGSEAYRRLIPAQCSCNECRAIYFSLLSLS